MSVFFSFLKVKKVHDWSRCCTSTNPTCYETLAVVHVCVWRVWHVEARYHRVFTGIQSTSGVVPSDALYDLSTKWVLLPFINKIPKMIGKGQLMVTSKIVTSKTQKHFVMSHTTLCKNVRISLWSTQTHKRGYVRTSETSTKEITIRWQLKRRNYNLKQD